MCSQRLSNSLDHSFTDTANYAQHALVDSVHHTLVDYENTT